MSRFFNQTHITATATLTYANGAVSSYSNTFPMGTTETEIREAIASGAWREVTISDLSITETD